MCEKRSDSLKELFERAVEKPNTHVVKKGYIRCLECQDEIFYIPNLDVMGEAIERHVNMHKDQLADKPLLQQKKAIFIRLFLLNQVLERLKGQN